MPPAPSRALAASRAVLRVLIVVNWISIAGIAAILVGLFAAKEWMMRALGTPLTPATEPLLMGLRVVAALGLVVVPLNAIVLKRLLAIVDTVRAGDPFVSGNADRLRAIAWAALGLQVLQLVIGSIAKAVSGPGQPLSDASAFSITGWLAVLLLFVLARVFAEGSRMRADLEGTV